MSGQWPPEWEDSDNGLPDEWTDSDAGLEAEASEVTLFLASVPSPMLPASFEARISAAIAAEAAARADDAVPTGTESARRAPADAWSADTASSGAAGVEPTGAGFADAETAAAETDDAKATDRSTSQEVFPTAAESGAAAAARHRRRRSASGSRGTARKSGPAGSRPGGRRRRFRLPAPAVTAPMVVVLFIVGFVVLLTHFGGSSTYSGSFSSGTSAVGSVPAASGEHSTDAGSKERKTFPYEGAESGPSQFVVTESGTRYLESTLARQVKQHFASVTPAAQTPTQSAAASSPSSSAEPASSASASAESSAAAGTTPGPGLTGCVSHLTKGVMPTLVDRATYDGIPAYIIATSSRVWVVGLGCSAADTQLITSVSLSG